MAVFEVEGTAYPVQAGSVRLTYEDIDGKRRRFDGSMSSATRGTSARARTWSVVAGLLTDAEADEMESLIEAPGYVEISGDLIGESVVCELGGSRAEGRQADQVLMAITAREILDSFWVIVAVDGGLYEVRKTGTAGLWIGDGSASGLFETTTTQGDKTAAIRATGRSTAEVTEI